jgi:hypothetical protein
VPDHVEHGATRVGRSTSFTGRGKRKCSAGVGWEQQGNRVLIDIAGEAVQDTFEVILRMLLQFFNVCSRLIMISRVLTPASDCEPKLFFGRLR